MHPPTAHLSSQSRSDNIPGEPILIETSEKQQEELVITLDISKAHAQLRRLKNEGCALQEPQTIVTAIPSHKTRAMFECIKFPEDVNTGGASGIGVGGVVNDPATLGFIMFECGLEGIGTKIVKRSQFEKSENAENNMKQTTTSATATTASTIQNDNDFTDCAAVPATAAAATQSSSGSAGAVGSCTSAPTTVTTGGAPAAQQSTVIEIHPPPQPLTAHSSLVAKTTETLSKFSVKKPGTPKAATPREKLLATFELKSSKDSKEPPHMLTPGVKDNKIKFSLKTANDSSTYSGGGTSTATSSVTPQPSEECSKESNTKQNSNGSSGSNNGVVSSVSNNNGRTSSCVIDLKTVWFNFAAPPRAPITRKIDFTR